MKLFSIWSAAVLLNQASALPHIDPETPIPLNGFKFHARDGVDPHMGIDPETIRKYASQVSSPLDKRAIDFDPEKQLVDGQFH